MDDCHDFLITDLTYGGDGIGRLADGRAVFVPYTLPGERVRARLIEEKRGHARAELLEVLTPSPQRIRPRCPHFHQLAAERSLQPCGGCHYQHMPYDAQLAAKAAILRQQLQRLGGLETPPVRPVVASPKAWNYRNHIQFHLTPQGQLGFEALRSNHVVPIRECHLPEEALDALWSCLDIEAIPGLERVSLRLGAGEEALLVLESADPQPPELTVEELPLSVVHLSPAGVLVLAGSDHLVMEVSGRFFRVSAESFFQVNTSLAAQMVAHLLDQLPLSPQAVVVEVYCGVGLFSAFLAEKVKRLIGIEVSPSACADFEVNLDEFDNVVLYEARAEEALPAIDARPDVVVVDPPRAGLGPAVLQALLALGAPVLAYVSCDPATLGRDAKRLLAGGYRLADITPFDMFPQTYHIESVSLWVK